MFPPHAHLFNSKSESRSILSDSLRPHGLYSPRNSPGQNTGVGSLSLLWGIFPTQVSHIAFCGILWILYQLSHTCKESAGSAGDGVNTWVGKSPGRGHGNTLQYSCLENFMDRGACQDTVHRVAESDSTKCISTLFPATEFALSMLCI